MTEERWLSTRNIISYTFSTEGMYCWYCEADNPNLFTGSFSDDVLEAAFRTSPLTGRDIVCPDFLALVEE